MATQDFLVGLLSAAGGGAALWVVMAFIIKAFPSLNRHSDLKFWLTMVMSFIIPTLAYFILVAAYHEEFTWEGLILAIGAGYQISQTVHRGTEKLGEALNKQ